MTGEAVKQRVREYMRSWEMTEPGDGLLAGVSGGADSVCLLFLLDELKEELGIRLAAFHLNHGLRGAEADRDEAYVKEICGRLGIPLAVAHENVAEYAAARGISGEEAGRILRYEHMKETAEQFSCQKTATAHHRDDSAETVLFNMFRGSGLKGLSGIRPVRGEVIRPLLCLSRAEIAGYLEERGIPWCEDSTNGENVYTRNRIRNQLLPWVKENINARAPEHILAAAELAAQADAYFAELAEKLLADAGDLERLPEDAGDVSEALAVSIPTEIFDRQPPVVQGYLVRAMAARAAGSPRDISAKHVEAVRALTGPGGGTEAVLPYGLRAVRGYDRLEVAPEKRLLSREAGGRALQPFPVKTRLFSYKKGMEIPKNQYTKWFDCGKIKGTPVVRSRQSGDYITLADGRTKTVRRFMIDEKIPREKRDSVLLLADGSHILWIVGYRISEYYKVGPDTVRVMEVRMGAPARDDPASDVIKEDENGGKDHGR